MTIYSSKFPRQALRLLLAEPAVFGNMLCYYIMIFCGCQDFPHFFACVSHVTVTVQTIVKTDEI